MDKSDIQALYVYSSMCFLEQRERLLALAEKSGETRDDEGILKFSGKAKGKNIKLVNLFAMSKVAVDLLGELTKS